MAEKTCCPGESTTEFPSSAPPMITSTDVQARDCASFDLSGRSPGQSRRSRPRTGFYTLSSGGVFAAPVDEAAGLVAGMAAGMAAEKLQDACPEQPQVPGEKQHLEQEQQEKPAVSPGQAAMKFRRIRAARAGVAQ